MPAMPLLLTHLGGEALALDGRHAALLVAADELPGAQLVWSEGDPEGALLGVWFDGRVRAYHRFADFAEAYAAVSDPFFCGTLSEYRFIYPLASRSALARGPLGGDCTDCGVRAALGPESGERCLACYRISLLRVGLARR